MLPPAQVERRQEGDHSLISRGSVNRRVGGSYVSMQLRMQEVTRIFESRDEGLRAEFLEAFSGILKPDVMASKLGFAKHPLYVKAIEEGLSGRAKRQLASVFMYSLDVESQHTFLKLKRKKREQKTGRMKRAVEKWRKSKEPPASFSSASIEQAALADHLQGFLATQPRNIMLSVPASQTMGMQNLQASLTSSSQRVSGSQQPLQNDVEPEANLCADEASLVAATDSASMVFFRVVPLNINRQRLIAMPAANARRLSKHDLCVTIHDAQRNVSDANKDSPIVSVEARTATAVQNSVAVLPLLRCDLEALRADMKVWVQRKAPRYLISGVESEAMQNVEGALQRLVACKAFPRSDNVLEVAASDDSSLQQLRVLLGHRIVEQVCARRDQVALQHVWSSSASCCQ